MYRLTETVRFRVAGNRQDTAPSASMSVQVELCLASAWFFAAGVELVAKIPQENNRPR